MGLFDKSKPIAFTDEGGRPQIRLEKPAEDASDQQWLDFAAVVGFNIIVESAFVDGVALWNRAAEAYLSKWGIGDA